MVCGIGGALVAVFGVVIAVRGRIGDRSGWSMDAPVSAAIAGGLFAVAGLGLVLFARFGLRAGRGAPTGPDATGGSVPPPPPES